jgi:hypothetical protein
VTAPTDERNGGATACCTVLVRCGVGRTGDGVGEGVGAGADVVAAADGDPAATGEGFDELLQPASMRPRAAPAAAARSQSIVTSRIETAH